MRQSYEAQLSELRKKFEAEQSRAQELHEKNQQLGREVSTGRCRSMEVEYLRAKMLEMEQGAQKAELDAKRLSAEAAAASRSVAELEERQKEQEHHFKEEREEAKACLEMLREEESS